MMRGTRLVERYVAAAILPYAALALLLLTAILVTQQSNRFAELVGQAQAPLSLVLEITFNLTPSLLVFTAPMAVLAGTLIGFSRLGGDSELTALRAAGVGTWRLFAAPLAVGCAASFALLWLNLYYAPVAAGRLRDAALRAAEERLRSPVQPGTFTVLKDQVIYVRDGDERQGVWKGVFVFTQKEDGRGLLVTAESGRLDSSQDAAELVLQNAVATTLDLSPRRGAAVKSLGREADPDRRSRAEGLSLPGAGDASKQVVSEQASHSRIKLEDDVGLLVKRLRERQPELDESSWERLDELSRSDGAPARRRAARIALHKKFALGIAPLCFALLGAAAGGRVQRGGRGSGAALSLAIMVFYYLLVLAGEGAARSGALPIVAGVWLATGATFVAGLAVLFAPRLSLSRLLAASLERVGGADQAKEDAAAYAAPRRAGAAGGASYSLFGLLDRDVCFRLGVNFLFALAALSSVFVIFTIFEVWRYVSANNTGWRIVGAYTFYLLPFVLSTLAPVAVLVAVLFTYAVLSRRSETIAWLAAGQSIYRLFVPSLALACVVGGALWLSQDELLPSANRRQDALRDQMRAGAPKTAVAGGRRWVAGDKYLYTYNAISLAASDTTLEAPIVFLYDRGATHVERVAFGTRGAWSDPHTLEIADEFEIRLSPAGTATYNSARGPLRIEQPERVQEDGKLAFLPSPELEKLAEGYERRGDAANATKARLTIEKRSTAGVAPLVMVIVAVPLAIAFGRRGVLLSLSGAVLVGVLFWGASSGFELLGSYGLLPVRVAVWGAPTLFAVAGSYLLARART